MAKDFEFISMATKSRSTLVAVVLGSILCLDLSAPAATYYWTRPAGQSGDWSVATNWGGVEPTSNDIANVINGGTVTITQEEEAAWILKLGGGSVVNHLNGSLSLSSLWDEPGSFTYNISGGTLSAEHPYYSGAINQSGGQIEVSGFGLFIGGGRGPASYAATGGTLDATTILVGATSGGEGTMTMSNSTGGNPVTTVTGPNGIVVGNGDPGTLNMSGGMLHALAGPMRIGTSDQGIVNQTGGLISCTGLYFGQSFGFHSYTYNLDGGTLEVSFIELAFFGTYAQSAFNFGGGTLQASGDFTTAQPMTLTGDGGNANVHTAGFEVTLSGQLSGSGGLNKLGSNTLVLSAINTYTGPTVVNAGALQVDGALAASSTVTVESGAILSGNGAAGDVIVNSGGHIKPGALPGSIGELTFNGELTLNSGASLEFDLAGISASDRISMPLSTLYLNGQQFSDFAFAPQNGFGPGTYTLIDANLIQGSVGGEVSGTIGNYLASISISGGDMLLVVSVPEPSAIALALAAIGCIVGIRLSALG